MNSRSQAGQDLFVHALHPTPGIFLDVGAAGLSISNTLGLEEIGWRGWLIDNSEEAHKASRGRIAVWQTEDGKTFEGTRFICSDATHLNYDFLPPIVEYLSLDIDGASLDALRRIFETAPHTRFRIITAEHDFYSRGELLRTPMLELLRSKGYDILCADVCHEGKSFEIWAVHPDLVDMNVANKIRYNTPADWKEILELD